MSHAVGSVYRNLSVIASKIAEIHKISEKALAGIKGKGPRGLVMKADILEYINNPKAAVEAQPAAAKPKAKTAAESPAAYEDIEVTTIRKVIADRLLESKRTIPHYYLSEELKMDKLIKLRSDLNAAGGADGKELKLSINDLIIKATALASSRVREINTQWAGKAIRSYANIDVSVAVATDTGLITPIVKRADTKSLQEISKEVKDLAKRAKENKLKPEEFIGGTITISNLGMFGIDTFQGVINPPHALILSVGATKGAVVPGDEAGKLKVEQHCWFSISCDHRLVDGAVAAKWLQAFKSIVENPLNMF